MHAAGIRFYLHKEFRAVAIGFYLHKEFQSEAEKLWGAMRPKFAIFTGEKWVCSGAKI